MNYKNLVFKGGGVKIYSSVGAIKVLEEEGVLDGIENVAGSSAGSVIALLVSLGMTASEIKDFVINKFDPMIEIAEECPALETKRFFEEYGRYPGIQMRKQIAEILIEKTGDKDITFSALNDMGFKNLYIPATDLTDQKLVVFSHHDTPDFKVIDAIHASSAYPLFLTPIKTEDGHLLCDAGVLNNYPIDLFDSDEFMYNKALEYNTETLGIFLGSKNNNVSYGLTNLSAAFAPFNNMDPKLIEEYIESLNDNDFTNKKYDILSYIESIIDTAMKSNKVIHHEEREIFINHTRDLYPLNLEISEKQRLELFSDGENAAHNFFHPSDL